MLGMLIIGLFCGCISILFTVMEINESLDNWNRLTKGMKWYEFYKAPYYAIKAWSPVIIDTGITLGVIGLFSMGGMIGSIIALMSSSVISGYLYFRRKKLNRLYRTN